MINEAARRRLHDIWNHLHHHPEPSMEEFATSEYLAGLLAAAGLEPRKFPALPGFTVDVGEGDPRVGLRADMDALVQEVAGKPTLVHSCGHDANMAIVATVMLELAGQPEPVNGAVRAIFQPAEESGNGAERVAALGVADDLAYLFGVHLRPQQELPAPRLAPAISHGACLFASGTIIGEDHHGARPHLGASAIDIALEISTGLKQGRPPNPKLSQNDYAALRRQQPQCHPGQWALQRGPSGPDQRGHGQPAQRAGGGLPLRSTGQWCRNQPRLPG